MHSSWRMINVKYITYLFILQLYKNLIGEKIIRAKLYKTNGFIALNLANMTQ